MPPDLFNWRVMGGPDGRPVVQPRPRADQVRLLAYDQVRSAEEDKRAEALASIGLGAVLKGLS